MKYPVTLLAEYNSDAYQKEVLLGTILDSSPISYGFEWKGIPNTVFRLTYQQGNQVGLSISSSFDTKKDIPPKRALPFYSATEERNLSKAPSSLNFDRWYDRLYYDLKRSGIVLLQTQLISESNQVIIEIKNQNYNYVVDAVNRVLTLSELHLPKSIKNINVIVNEKDFQVMTISYRRTVKNPYLLDNIRKSQVQILGPRKITEPTNITVFGGPRVFFGADLSAKFQLFDPDLPLKHQLFLKISSTLSLGKNWYLKGIFDIDIDNNFDTNRGPNSRLPHVRTDINRYLTEGRIRY